MTSQNIDSTCAPLDAPKSVPSGVPAHGWVKQVSRSQNRPYWYHVLTGKSVWDEPEECKVEGDKPQRVHGKRPRQAEDLLHPDAFQTQNTEVYAAGLNTERYREAVLSICLRINEGDNTIETADGFHRFPPPPRADTSGLCDYTVAEVADEVGLSLLLTGEDTIPRHTVVWRSGCEPPEMRFAAAEEVRLVSEAAARRNAEVASAIEAAKKAAEAAPEAVGGKKAGSAANSRLDGVELMDAAPLASGHGAASGLSIAQASRWAGKRDKRTIAEMTEDIRRKKARADEAASAADTEPT